MDIFVERPKTHQCISDLNNQLDEINSLQKTKETDLAYTKIQEGIFWLEEYLKTLHC